jgi:hypothetical protein
MAAVGLEPTGESIGETSETRNSVLPGGAESGAPSHVIPSPVLSLLTKLAADVTADERAVLARALERGADELPPRTGE